MNGRPVIPLPSRPFESPMTLAVRNSRVPVAANPSLVAAGADEAEADPAQRVAADPSVIDAERHPLYGHGVQHAPNLEAATRKWLAALDRTEDERLAAQREHVRRLRLSRWQEQR